tara:strand:+ start:809 stop:1342 length:534 start_codon:yes stop_codon:yes gene_type:complete
MNQKFVIVDDFYDIAHKYHQSFFNNQCMITEETTQKLSYILGSPVEVVEAFNEITFENSGNPITANTAFDWISVIYLTMPPDCVSKKGLSFYNHKKTGLDNFPNEYVCQVNGWQNVDDIVKSFDLNDKNEWEEYVNVFVKYNRCVIFRADYWHSYGHGFGNEINNSMLSQKLLLKNV